MQVTEVRLRLIEGGSGSKLRAFASITLDKVFVVHDLKVIEGKQGLFVAMPNRKTSGGEYKDIAHPIDPATRSYVNAMVLAEYEKKQKESRLFPLGD